MPRRIRIQGLEAELAAVDALLAAARELGDPMGEYQLSRRRERLARDIEDLASTAEMRASVALFFGGKPVIGSRGIVAEFAGSMLESFQDLVAKSLASEDVGELGERGPVPNKRAADLIVTSLARGSFGFVLDEPELQGALVETRLKTVVENAVTIVEKIASSNEEDFEEVVEEIDSRLLMALKGFFQKLDTSGATIRLVDERADVSLDGPSVRRGRIRTEQTDIAENEESLTGTIVGFLPEHRKFEMKVDDEQVVYGSVTPEALDQYNVFLKDGQPPFGERWSVRMKVRTVTPLNHPSKKVYRLLAFERKV